eukprot:TRINITY_DN7208_c0_g1_i2.p2 TRINITY_DN7208_c0_g1~~TRINITY_DN7208_c0_g1_i2.p2  ORF type:complete len:192 (-),score=30.47 TRINITY_DN7208_c0_g1_i2:1582-2130(-)
MESESEEPWRFLSTASACNLRVRNINAEHGQAGRQVTCARQRLDAAKETQKAVQSRHDGLLQQKADAESACDSAREELRESEETVAREAKLLGNESLALALAHDNLSQAERAHADAKQKHIESQREMLPPVPPPTSQNMLLDMSAHVEYMTRYALFHAQFRALQDKREAASRAESTAQRRKW